MVSYGINIHLFYDAAIVLLGNHPREMETYPHGTRMSTAASSSGEWKNELWHIHTMDKKRQTTVHKITREISKLRRWAKEARHVYMKGKNRRNQSMVMKSGQWCGEGWRTVEN